MTVQTLEKISIEITGETCIHHFRSMHENYVPEEDVHHRNCDGLNRSCPSYSPIKIYEKPLNPWRFG